MESIDHAEVGKGYEEHEEIDDKNHLLKSKLTDLGFLKTDQLVKNEELEPRTSSIEKEIQANSNDKESVLGRPQKPLTSGVKMESDEEIALLKRENNPSRVEKRKPEREVERLKKRCKELALPDEATRDKGVIGVKTPVKFDSRKRKQTPFIKDGYLWESNYGMLLKDPLACMKAVCALYRKQTPEGKKRQETFILNRQGFSMKYAPGGSRLAEFLTGGDPDKDVAKSVEELRGFDPNGVEECREIAEYHSNQLLQIYEKGEDPYFFRSASN